MDTLNDQSSFKPIDYKGVPQPLTETPVLAKSGTDAIDVVLRQLRTNTLEPGFVKSRDLLTSATESADLEYVLSQVAGVTQWVAANTLALSLEAEDINYFNGTSGLSATDVQAAIDEIVASGSGGGDFLPLAGGTMLGPIVMGTNHITWDDAGDEVSSQTDIGPGYFHTHYGDNGHGLTVQNGRVTISNEAGDPGVFFEYEGAGSASLWGTIDLNNAGGIAGEDGDLNMAMTTAGLNFYDFASPLQSVEIGPNRIGLLKNTGDAWTRIEAGALHFGTASGSEDWQLYRDGSGIARFDAGMDIRRSDDGTDDDSLIRRLQLDAYQLLDADLTAIAALTPTNDDVLQRKAGAWTNRTIAQLKSDLAITLASISGQPLDSDLTTIAGLTATTDNFLQSKGSAWASRTVAQVVTDLVAGGLLTAATAASTYQPLGSYQPTDADLTTIAGLTATTDSFMQAKGSAWAARTVAQVVTDLVAGGLLTAATAASTYQPLGSYQPTDTDLTTIAGLTATTDSFMQAKGSAWSARTVAQVVTDLVAGGLLTSATAASTYQPLDGDLTTIAGLTATTDNFIQSKGSAWASRTPAQVATDLVAAGLLTAATAASTYLTTVAAAAAYQPLDADLTTIAGLTATTDSFLQAKGSAWTARTITQVRSDLFISVDPRSDLEFGVKSRQHFPISNGGVNTSAAVTNLVQATPVILEAGDVVHAFAVQANGAATTPTHQWMALYDSAGNLLRQSTDQTTTAWAAGQARRFVLTSDYTITTSGIYYVVLHFGGTTGPTLYGASTGGTWPTLRTIYTGMAHQGRSGALASTATAPASLTAASTNSFQMWALVELT